MGSRQVCLISMEGVMHYHSACEHVRCLHRVNKPYEGCNGYSGTRGVCCTQCNRLIRRIEGPCTGYSPMHNPRLTGQRPLTPSAQPGDSRVRPVRHHIILTVTLMLTLKSATPVPRYN